MTGNKYSKYFNEDMSSLEAGYQYFSLYDESKAKGELELLDKAYFPVVDVIMQKELDRPMGIFA